MHKGIGLTVAVALTAVVGSGSAHAADKIKVGVFSTLEGTYTALGEDGMRGFDLAVMQHHNKARRQRPRDHQGFFRCQPRLGTTRRQEAGRAGQSRPSDRPAFRRGRNCLA